MIRPFAGLRRWAATILAVPIPSADDQKLAQLKAKSVTRGRNYKALRDFRHDQLRRERGR